MHKQYRKCIFFIIALISVVLLNCSKKEIQTIRISGSTTIEPFMKKVVIEYRKSQNVDIQLTAPGSKDGIDALIAGSCDIAMSSTKILPAQATLAEKQGIKLKAFLLGYDIIVPIVHPQNQLTNISLEKLKEIFSGQIKSWSALGGVDTLVDVIDRDAHSGTYHVWNKMVSPSDPADTNITFLPSNSSVLANISVHTNAIGYVSSVYLNPEVKPLTVDGFKVTDIDTLASKYPIKRALYLYVDESNFTDEIKLLTIHVMMNKHARELFRETGFFAKKIETE